MAMLHVRRQDPVTERHQQTGRASNTGDTRGHVLGKQARFVVAEFIRLFSSFLERMSETEQDPVILAPASPTMSFPCPLSVESFSQKVSFIREMRNAETKENSQGD